MTDATEGIAQVEAQMVKDIGDLAASPIKDEQGDAKDAEVNEGHIEGTQARGKNIQSKQRQPSGEVRNEVDKATSTGEAAPGETKAEAVETGQQDTQTNDAQGEQTITDSSSDEEDYDDEEDSSDYTEDATDTDSDDESQEESD